MKSVRLPREAGDGGRLRGFGYAEFETRQDLVDALTMNELVRLKLILFCLSALLQHSFDVNR